MLCERGSGNKNGEEIRRNAAARDEKVLFMAEAADPGRLMPEQRDIPRETVASPDQSSFS